MLFQEKIIAIENVKKERDFHKMSAKAEVRSVSSVASLISSVFF
jgi:hypothetical protein